MNIHKSLSFVFAFLLFILPFEVVYSNNILNHDSVKWGKYSGTSGAINKFNLPGPNGGTYSCSCPSRKNCTFIQGNYDNSMGCQRFAGMYYIPPDSSLPAFRQTAEKPEGIWFFSAQDSANSVEVEFRYDTISPECISEIDKKGLNGQWTNDSITFTPSCIDRYRQGSTISHNDNCQSVDPITIYRHDKTPTWTLTDIVNNSISCQNSSASKIDWNLPDSPTGMKIEHAGLGLAAVNVSTDSSNPISFRANEEDLSFTFSAQDSQYTTADGDSNGFASGISGLDFSRSTLTIQKTAPDIQTKSINLAGAAGAGLTAPPATSFGNFMIDLNSYSFDENDEFPIFTQTGKYKIWLDIYDLAGNTIKSDSFYIDIYPAEADNEQSTLSGFECDNDSLFANNLDKCSGKLTAKDKYGNIIFGREFRGYFGEQNVKGSYNLIADTIAPNVSAQTAFENGLRFVSEPSLKTSATSFLQQNHTQTFETADGDISNPGDGKTENIEISSLVPSLLICASNDLGTFADQRARNTGFLGKKQSRIMNLYFDSPPVLENGEIDSAGEPVTLIFDENKLNFDSLLKATISNNAGGETSDFNILLEEEKEIYVQSSTETTTDNLPENFQVYLYGQAPEDTQFDQEDLSTNGNLENDDLDGVEIDFSSLSPQTGDEKSINTHLRGIGDVELSNLESAFTSQVKIPILENGSIRNVIYPGGNFGNMVGKHSQSQELFSCPEYAVDNSDIKGFTIGANISGNILTSGTSAIQNDESTAVDLGGIEVKDIREETTTNAYEIIRGMDPNDLNERIEIADFSSGKDVIYYSGGTVQLGEASRTFTFSGVKTIVIEDGNLLIGGDIEYAGPTDSLGVILINSNIGEKPKTGNIFINNEVKKFVGTYFADGSLTSTEATGVPTSIPDIKKDELGGIDYIDRDAAGLENVLKKQLLLEGTLFTKNTLGGAMLGDGNLRNPWGEEPILDEAQKYDLHFVRRYSPLLFTDQNEKLEHCVNISETQCDPEGSSFLIRPDNRVQFFPPPGFSSN